MAKDPLKNTRRVKSKKEPNRKEKHTYAKGKNRILRSDRKHRSTQNRTIRKRVEETVRRRVRDHDRKRDKPHQLDYTRDIDREQALHRHTRLEPLTQRRIRTTSEESGHCYAGIGKRERDREDRLRYRGRYVDNNDYGA